MVDFGDKAARALARGIKGFKKQQSGWNLRRLKAVHAELEASLLKGTPMSQDSLDGLSEGAHIPDALKSRAAMESGRVAGHVMGVVLRRGKTQWAKLDEAIAAMRRDERSAGLSRDLLAYLKGAQRLDRYVAKSELFRRSEAAFLPHLDDLARIVDQTESEFPKARSLSILRGCIASLTDRSAAAVHFQEATEAGEDAMATSIYDLGAHTYFAAPEVWSRRTVADFDLGRAELEVALSSRPPPFNRAWLNLVWSVDAGFLRIYGPYWFNLAPYLLNEGIGLVMVVIGEESQVDFVIEEARDLIARTARFHNLPNGDLYARAFSFVRLSLPPNVGEAKTFYASARYLIAGKLLELTNAPIMILDADQTLRDPIGPFVRGLKDADFGVTRSRGMQVLWPWRRNMAGTAVFKPGPASQLMLDRIRDYVWAGLPQTPSWTLDQNAISFALECVGDSAKIDDLAAKTRPLFQDKVRTVFEKTYREGPPTPP